MFRSRFESASRKTGVSKGGRIQASEACPASLCPRSSPRSANPQIEARALDFVSAKSLRRYNEPHPLTEAALDIPMEMISWNPETVILEAALRARGDRFRHVRSDALHVLRCYFGQAFFADIRSDSISDSDEDAPTAFRIESFMGMIGIWALSSFRSLASWSVIRAYLQNAASHPAKGLNPAIHSESV